MYPLILLFLSFLLKERVLTDFFFKPEKDLPQPDRLRKYIDTYWGLYDHHADTPEGRLADM
jgi:hypothetical protein